MKNTLSIILLVGLIAFAAYATNQRGEWSTGTFIFNLFLSGIISGAFLLVASLFVREDMRIVVGIVYIGAMVTYLDRVQAAKQRDDRSKVEQRERYNEYMKWYNSLTPYEKLQHDNERLREENAILESIR